MRGDQTCRVDFGCEPVPQTHDQKQQVQGIPIDPLDEIMANKIRSLVGRSAARDFWDLWPLAAHGFSLEDALASAERSLLTGETRPACPSAECDLLCAA